jgi:hypothetical protein
LSEADMSLIDVIGGSISFLLTLFILSYALGDNFLFRLAIYLFIGISAGFTAAAAFYSVIWPRLIRPLVFGTIDERLLVLVPFILGLILLTKALPKFSVIGSPIMAFIVGIGAATIVGGALTGTLFPQVSASLNLLNIDSIQQSGANPILTLLNGALILFGIVATFASFHYSTRFIQNSTSQAFWKMLYWIGRVFVAITFGVIFAGIFLASLTALVDRFKSILDFILTFLSPAS